MKIRSPIALCPPLLLVALLASTGCSVSVHTHEHAANTGTTHTSHHNAAHTDPTPDWSTFSPDNTQVGRINFSGQPTPQELRAFAAAGGKVVINNRSESEMESVDFNERALAESLGLTYIQIPISATTFSKSDAMAMADAIDTTQGPIFAHCGSGSRSAMAYGLYLIEAQGMNKDNAIDAAIAAGMSPSGARYIERERMDIPGRVIDAVDPAQIRHYVDTLAGFGTRHTLSDTESDTRGIGAARRWVKAQFERNIEGHGKIGDAAPRAYFDAHTVQPDGRRITEPVEVVNVICEIPGSNPASRNRLYYVLGHLDSRASEVMDAISDAPGANDDASGVALMIELARVLAKEPIESTVILMATSGEEQGLFGARMHAQNALDSGKDIRAVLNNDTVGDPTGVIEGQDGSKEIRVFSEGLPASMITMDPGEISAAVRRQRLYGTESDSTSRQIARYIGDIARLHRTTVQPRLVHRPDRFLRGGDHTPFNELGFAAVRFCETYENYDHQHQDVRIEDGTQYGDLPEYVDEHYLADVTRLNAAVLVHLSNAPSTPENARVIIADLTNDTTLRWDASPEADVAGYEIVWRETSAAQWEEVLDVGNTTEGTVPLSKDNWFFGVRAYDHEGYRSPVAYPRPARE